MNKDVVKRKPGNFRLKTKKPFFVLAPMDDVTDTVFRQIVADCAPPDLYFTEFVNVDALQSAGRKAALRKLKFSAKEKPIIAQIWGKNPENFYKTAQELVKMGFDGVDINFGCPEKNVIKNGLCIAMINNRELAAQIIEATREGLSAGQRSSLPLSVKTRLGLGEIDYSWHEFLLKHKLNMLTIHGRTAKQLSKVPADWEATGKIREIRDKLSPSTLIIGNGDVMTLDQGEQLAKKHKLDGVMIGRGVFHDPFVFAPLASGSSPWSSYTKEQKIALYKKHVELFIKTWGSDKNIHTLNKFCKIYINGFDGAKELREKLMNAKSAEELLQNLDSPLK